MRSHLGRGCKIQCIPQDTTLLQYTVWKSHMSSDRQFWIMELKKVQSNENLCQMGTGTTYSHSAPHRTPHGTSWVMSPLRASKNLWSKVLFLAFKAFSCIFPRRHGSSTVMWLRFHLSELNSLNENCEMHLKALKIIKWTFELQFF